MSVPEESKYKKAFRMHDWFSFFESTVSILLLLDNRVPEGTISLEVSISVLLWFITFLWLSIFFFRNYLAKLTLYEFSYSFLCLEYLALSLPYKGKSRKGLRTYEIHVLFSFFRMLFLLRIFGFTFIRNAQHTTFESHGVIRTLRNSRRAIRPEKLKNIVKYI